MADWTDKDTDALAECLAVACPAPPSTDGYIELPAVDTDLPVRAAAEIRRLQARVAELEANNEALQAHVAMRTEILAMAERADTIPRAALVGALRERAALWETQSREALASRRGSAEDKRWAHNVAEAKRYECNALADEIERGEWPGTKEGT